MMGDLDLDDEESNTAAARIALDILARISD